MKNKIKQEIVKAIEGIETIVVLGIILAIILFLNEKVITTHSNENNKLYNKDKIEIKYEEYSDYIEVKNDTNKNIEINIGDNKYSICNTNGKYVILALNVTYGKVNIHINDDIVTINYREKVR